MKKVIIVGGDKVAYYLIGLLSEEYDYDVRLIDTRVHIAERIANDFDVKVYHGDGTNVSILERAEAQNADVLIALTGNDESNLVACQIAKIYFDVKLTIAKVNNPRNASVMKILGVDRIFSNTKILAQMIDQEVTYSGMTLAYNVPGTSKAIIGVPLHPDSDAVGQSLNDYHFVGDSRVVMITRMNGEIVIPTGDVQMRAGDTLLIIADEKDFEEIWQTFIRPEGSLPQLSNGAEL